MNNIRRVSIKMLKKSKSLSLACICSIMIAIILLISLWNLMLSASDTYKQNLRSEYGDFDILISCDGGESFNKTDMDFMKDIKGVKDICFGYYDSSFLIGNITVYSVWCDNSNMIKSRYKYSNSLSSNDIVINRMLAEYFKVEVGSYITINGMQFYVSEILEDSASTYLALFSIDSLRECYPKEEKMNNFSLIRTYDDAGWIADKIKDQNGDLLVETIEGDELYKANLVSFSLTIRIISIIVVLITGLFVASIMKKFIYKYRHDLSVIRAIGGTRNQVSKIIKNIIISIATIGCFSGFIIAACLNRFLVKNLDNIFSIKLDMMKFHVTSSFFITVICYLCLIAILQFRVLKSCNILPIQALSNNELDNIGARKKRKRKNRYRLTYLLSKENYIAFQFLRLRLKETLNISFIIILLVVVSIVGNTLCTVIEKNNATYLHNKYQTDVIVNTNAIIQYGKIHQYLDGLETDGGMEVSYFLTNPTRRKYNGKTLNYTIGNIKTMISQGLFSVMKDTKGAIISDGFALQYGKSIGDYIEIGQMKLKILEIATYNKLRQNDVLIDISMVDSNSIEESVITCILINGDTNYVNESLVEIEKKIPEIYWSSYENELMISNSSIRDRFILFEVIISILIFIAGLGWYNAVKYSILSKKYDYDLLKILGITQNNIIKILMTQLITYIFIGIVIGTVVGTLIVAILLKLESSSNPLFLDMNTITMMAAYLVILGVLILPNIIKMGKGKIDLCMKRE